MGIYFKNYTIRVPLLEMDGRPRHTAQVYKTLVVANFLK